MTLKQWQDNGWLRPYKTSAEEIRNLLQIVERDLKDAQGPISPDWQFGIAYNAALKLCTILLYSNGFRPDKALLAHYRTLKTLPLVLGPRWEKDADYLDACRAKRNTVEYDYAGGASETDSTELIDFVRTLKKDVLDWLKNNQPHLLKS